MILVELSSLLWKLFATTGNIETYLLYRRAQNNEEAPLHCTPEGLGG